MKISVASYYDLETILLMIFMNENIKINQKLQLIKKKSSFNINQGIPNFQQINEYQNKY